MTNSGFQHNPNRDIWDDYPTHPAWTRALTDNIKIRGRIWEPAAGEGMMANELTRLGYDVRATDIRMTGDDFTQHSGEWEGSIVTNPPYRQLMPFIDIALASATEQVAMLISVHALGGMKRHNTLWQPRPPAQLVYCPRLMKVRGVSSQFYHVWAVWDRQHQGPTVFTWAKINDRVNKRDYNPEVDL